MTKRQIEDDDYWWLQVVYSVLTAFTNSPEHTISQFGAGKISVPEDQIAHLSEYYHLLVGKYPDLKSTEISRVIERIEFLSPSSHSEKEFWTNDGFRSDDRWIEIRKLCREFLLR